MTASSLMSNQLFWFKLLPLATVWVLIYFFFFSILNCSKNFFLFICTFQRCTDTNTMRYWYQYWGLVLFLLVIVFLLFYYKHINNKRIKKNKNKLWTCKIFADATTQIPIVCMKCVHFLENHAEEYCLNRVGYFIFIMCNGLKVSSIGKYWKRSTSGFSAYLAFSVSCY